MRTFNSSPTLAAYIPVNSKGAFREQAYITINNDTTIWNWQEPYNTTPGHYPTSKIYCAVWGVLTSATISCIVYLLTVRFGKLQKSVWMLPHVFKVPEFVIFLAVKKCFDSWSKATKISISSVGVMGPSFFLLFLLIPWRDDQTDRCNKHCVTVCYTVWSYFQLTFSKGWPVLPNWHHHVT